MKMPEWLVEELQFAFKYKDVDYIIDLNRQWNEILKAHKRGVKF